jgi:hypothetical protein
MLFWVGVLFIACGAISVMLAKGTVRWNRRDKSLKLMSKDELGIPIKGRTVIYKRVGGLVFIGLGILLIKYPGALSAPFSTAPIDFESAVRAIVAAEGLPLGVREPKPPDELRIVSARYGAQDIWIDVTEQAKARITGNILEIRAGNHLAGDDPLFGVPKDLRIEYVVDGERETAVVREGATLRIPGGDPFDELKAITTPERLVALAKSCPAEVGFYGKNFTTGRTVEYRPDQPACLASIVKIFVLLEVMRQVEEGAVDLSAPTTIDRQDGKETCMISEALDKMIGISDNEATNVLAELVGYDAVNALPQELGITGLSDQILPEPGVLEEVLDKRVFGLRVAQESDLLPQHGSARGIVQYLELAHNMELVNEKTSRRVLDVFDRNPKYFAPRATPPGFSSVGKGGSLGWGRPFRPKYIMSGWGILIRSEEIALGFCLWGEWFPPEMSRDECGQWLHGLSDCIVSILLLPVSDG